MIKQRIKTFKLETPEECKPQKKVKKESSNKENKIVSDKILEEFKFQKPKTRSTRKEQIIQKVQEKPKKIKKQDPDDMKYIRLGLCCINNSLKEVNPPIFCSRSITLATIQKLGRQEILDRAIKNVRDIIPIIEWNERNGIRCLRLSSDMFPHCSNPNLDKKFQYTIEFAHNDLKKAGDLAKSLGHRLTMHPGQYNVVSTPNDSSFQSTYLDLKHHADILDAMGVDENGVIVVHGGGVYGDKPAAIDRWCTNFKRLSENTQKRLVLENDEKSYSIEDCLTISERIGVPVVFDNHHHLCYIQSHPDVEFKEIDHYIGRVLKTWGTRRPKFHISEQREDAKLGTHSDFISRIPDYYLDIPKKYGIGVDIMIEAKAKEAAILKLFQVHPELIEKYESQI